MNCDCAFYIGTTHEVCQDYTLSGINSIVVSDGCSGSPMTDVGSRVLGITAINKIKELDSLFDFDYKECILLARPSIKILNMANECLDATLLAAHNKNGKLEAICLGDGVIVIKAKSGEKHIINCEYTDSYPYYMNYEYTNRLRGWIDNNNKREIHYILEDKNGETSHSTVASPFKKCFEVEDMAEIVVNGRYIIINVKDIPSIENISIMSDGVHSFYETVETDTSRYNKSISYREVLKELLNFKNYNKKFVQRRVNRFRKDCIKKKWGNTDDVSLATIYLGK